MSAGAALPARVAIGAVVVVGYALLAHALSTRTPMAWIYFAQDSALNVGLALLFATTLRRGETPLCSRIALLLQPQSSAQALRYARAATWAWATFFGAVVATSTALFFCATRATWSLFANVLYWPLLLAMFAIEYSVRVRLLPRAQRSGFFETMRAFTRLRGERAKRKSMAS